MKEIKVLGPGCASCEELAARSKKAAEELGIEYGFEKITDMMEIARHGVLLTPGLIIDGEVKSSGKLLSLDEIKAFLK